jgi:hypothetical protein
MVEPDGLQSNVIRCVRFACCINKAKTHIYKLIAFQHWTRLDVTLYLRYVVCLVYLSNPEISEFLYREI